MGALFNCKKEHSNNPIGEQFSQIYYQNSSSNSIHEDFNNPKEKINIYISLANIEEGSFYIQVHLSDDEFKTNKFLGRTNTKEGGNGQVLTFDTTVILDYYFEKKQKIRFTISKVGYKGSNHEESVIITTIASIMGARDQKVTLGYKGKSSLIVKGGTLKNNNINCVSIDIDNSINKLNIRIF